ncbi:long-chain fatty acid--CoA ligase [Vibrio sp. F13]|uniref:AMP-binding protein n=1 Tax=Vibrio sp. F13 TaxID=2070777 RepID=UPI0010BD086B|nr:AMP-binding protein [Vibrio sp. F13]TKF71873.1 long-chain fatty acid--CoA ligase [Vibrio sp. F13]
MHNLAVNLERSASLFPTKAALRMGSDEISFSQLEQLSGNVVANLKRLGLQNGDKVALSCPNVTYFPIAYYGILKAGCVVVPLNALLKAGEESSDSLENTSKRSEQVKHSLRLGVSGGASMPLEVIRQFESRFELPVLEGYGLSETAPVATFNHIDGDRLSGSVGQPLCGHLIKITDIQGNSVAMGELGEVCIKSPSVMKGYYQRPEATAESIRDGWFLTGDIGRVDEHGNLFIVDRVKDMIIRGGYNVYPREVEEVLMCHPDVEMVAVVGEHHEHLGEEIHAHVVLHEHTQCDSAALIAWCREQLADYKYPRKVFIRKALPMTATGKILKRELHPLEIAEMANG